jgi:hypothetical protein
MSVNEVKGLSDNRPFGIDRSMAAIRLFGHHVSFAVRTVALHRRLSQCEHRRRFTTSASSASHPASAVSV